MDAGKTEQFLRLISASEHDIFRYIFALTPDADAARDILQETTVDLWKKFEQYDSSRPFIPWACRFAYIHVLRLRKARQSSAVFLSNHALENISNRYLASRDNLNARRQALVKCMEKLPEPSQQLIHQRYTDGLTVQAIAERTHRSANTLYKQMTQIRQWLMDCTRRQAEMEGSV